MKIVYPLSALVLLAACSAPEAEAPVAEAPDADTAAMTEDAPVYSEDNLASSEACFADLPSALLRDGQALVERNAAGIVRLSYNLGGQAGDHTFSIAEANVEQRQMIDNAAADFFRAAGQAYDVTTDDVIYHRGMDGTFCAVSDVPEIAQPLQTAAMAIQANMDATED